MKRQYSDAMLDGMQSAYGEGFLSPGGVRELHDLLDGHELRGKDVLDLGCGVGGASLLLASEFQAGSVTGADVEAEQIRRATRLAASRDLEQAISFVRIDPGPLPFPTASFDCVITKDVICHLPDKAAFFAEVKRVLRPGGITANADWIKGTTTANAARYEDWVAQLAAAGLEFYFESVGTYRDALTQSGFCELRNRDHSVWSTRHTAQEVSLLTGDNEATARAALGEEVYKRRVRLTSTRHEAMTTGHLEHWHIWGSVPG